MKMFVKLIVLCVCGGSVVTGDDRSSTKLTGVRSIRVTAAAMPSDLQAKDLEDPKASYPFVTRRISDGDVATPSSDGGYTVLRYNRSDGTPSRTVILPKLDPRPYGHRRNGVGPRLPWSSASIDSFPIRKPEKTVGISNRPIFNPPSKHIRPEEPKSELHEVGNFFDDPDDNFVLVSDSSRPPTGTSESDYASYAALTTDPPTQKRYRIKKRKYGGNSTSSDSPVIEAYSSEPTSLKNSYATEKDAKFLNLFTIIRFPNDACSEEGGTCYHELECTGLGGIPTTRCARGYGVCCMIEATCGARTNINNTVFVGTETTLGSCSLSIDKVPCTKQIRLDFLQFDLEPPMDGECVKDRLFITGANRNVNVPVLCGSLTGQHIYLDVDEVPGPVVLNLISTKPLFRIKISQVCDGNPMLAPKSCLQYYRGRTGVIRSFNYVPASAISSYLNNLNYAICVAKEPDSCSISYSNETPEGMEFDFDIVNLDEDGALSVPPRQAGAEVFNCPDDYISISNVRLCGQKLNDGSVQVDFSRNYPVTDSTRGPYLIAVRSNEANVGKGFYLNYDQKSC